MGSLFRQAIWRRAQDDVVGPGVDKQSGGEAEGEEEEEEEDPKPLLHPETCKDGRTDGRTDGGGGGGTEAFEMGSTPCRRRPSHP